MIINKFRREFMTRLCRRRNSYKLLIPAANVTNRLIYSISYICCYTSSPRYLHTSAGQRGTCLLGTFPNADSRFLALASFVWGPNYLSHFSQPTFCIYVLIQLFPTARNLIINLGCDIFFFLYLAALGASKLLLVC